MNKDMMLSILSGQLKAANEFNVRLIAQVERLNGAVASMKSTIASLEAALLEKEEARRKEEDIKRGLSKIIGNKSEKQKVQPAESAEDVTGMAVEGVAAKPEYDPKSRGEQRCEAQHALWVGGGCERSLSRRGRV